MGDRANIAVVHHNGDQIWLYSHWGGSELPERLQEGLRAGKGRWSDESYLTKILFGRAVPADNWQEETGYGISGRMQDNGYPILVVDVPGARVFTFPEDSLTEDGKLPVMADIKAGFEWSFEQFIALPDVSWERLEHPEPVVKAVDRAAAGKR